MRIPTRPEALELLHSHQCENPARVAHSLAVAELALDIARALVERGHALDLPLVEAAAILHDIRKGHPDHDRSGADLLRSLGYGPVAAVVEVHTRLGGRTPRPEEAICESEVVYIADKSYRRVNRVSIEERYSIWKNTWKDNPERLESLTRGENRAKAVRERIEKALGRGLDEV